MIKQVKRFLDQNDIDGIKITKTDIGIRLTLYNREVLSRGEMTNELMRDIEEHILDDCIVDIIVHKIK